MDQLNKTLEMYLVDKAPKLPKEWQEVFVQFLPWVNLVLLILALPALLLLFGLGSILAPFAFMGGFGAGSTFTLGLVLSIISIIFEIIALPGLFNKTKSGWTWVYYATLISLIQNIVGFHVGGVLFSIFFLYLLFQVRHSYK